MALLSLANATSPMGSGQFLTLEHLLTIPPQGHLAQDPRTLMKEEIQVTHPRTLMKGNTSHTNYPGVLPGTKGVQGENKRKT